MVITTGDRREHRGPMRRPAAKVQGDPRNSEARQEVDLIVGIGWTDPADRRQPGTI